MSTARASRRWTPAVRQALSYAIDKDAFNQAVFGGINVPAASPLMKPTFAYEPKTEAMYTYDTAKARAMLDAAGWVLNGDVREKDGQKLELYWPIQDRQNDRNMSTFVQGAWREVGVDVTGRGDGAGRRAREPARRRLRCQLPLVLVRGPRYPTRDLPLRQHRRVQLRALFDPDVDKWLDEAAASLDPDARKALYSQVQIKVLEDAITIPLADSITYNAKPANLQGDFLDFLASYVWMNDAKFA